MLSNTYDKHKHLIGMQINKWTVLNIVEHRFKKKGYAYAQCQCICGTIRDVRLSKLLNNECKDCGCGHRERLNEAIKKKYEYLVNTQINGWTVLEIIPPQEEQTRTNALCRCQCGTVKPVDISYLIKGKSKDCGCGRKNTLSQALSKDLTGQKFGKLLAVERLSYKDKNGHTLYRCKCDCGNEVVLAGYLLTTSHTASCGCLLSYYNMYIDKYLDIIGIEHKAEHTVYIDMMRYRFDFYLPQYNLFIEYDGEQHYKPVRYYTQTDEEMEHTFHEIQRRDKIKNNYCKENNINLLRIPYWEKENIETIINNHLQRLNEKGYVGYSA